MLYLFPKQKKRQAHAQVLSSDEEVNRHLYTSPDLYSLLVPPDLYSLLKIVSC